jgi:transketolase
LSTKKDTGQLYDRIQADFDTWEKVKDCTDQFIDIMLNYRQSGHPGGSRSKVHAFVATLLGGIMRWDIRSPEKTFSDRFVLVAGHTVPLVYGTLPVLFETLRVKHRQTGDDKYLVPNAANRALYWEDLAGFRRNKGLPGHAEMEGKTLFLKFNTGPSGHGSPAAAGQALALKRAGAGGVNVFAFEGEGGLSPGAAHETMNSAWGLGLSNLVYVIDWNDFGIDPHRYSSVIDKSPREWFDAHGWRIYESEDGSSWESITRALVDAVHGDNPDERPRAVFMKTRKGRGYLKYDYASHGAPHKMNSDLFWQTKLPFMEKYGVEFDGYNQPAPDDPAARAEQMRNNLEIVANVIRGDQAMVDSIADRLVSLGDSVPDKPDTLKIDLSRNPLDDPRLLDYKSYPKEMFAKPGDKKPNRAGLDAFGSWVNSWCRKEYDRPLFIAMSADLAESTNIAGFAKDFGDDKGYGWYDRNENVDGTLLPQPITEFTNSGLSVGLATVNFSPKPFEKFNGFLSACSTYGSFSYLKYGMMRLFSQLAQDSPLKVGQVLWVVGHSGPETADDSRTHFGIFSPGVTQLFPEGHVVDVHPWEYNEVPVVIAAALKTGAPIVALHLTRPPIEIPDREALGMASHLEAARGAYLIRPFKPGTPRMGTVVVQGTSTTSNLTKILPALEAENINVKIVAAISPQLFALQDAEYRDAVFSPGDRMDAMAVTNRARRLMSDWIDPSVAGEYSLSSDWDDRWRTGGTLDEVIAEAHISPEHIFEGIRRFAEARPERLARIEQTMKDVR